MDPNTVIVLIGMATFAVALFTYLATMRRDLRSEMDARFRQVDTRFEQVDARFEQLISSMNSRFDQTDARVTELREDVRTGFASVENRLGVLENRTYELAARRTDAS